MSQRPPDPPTEATPQGPHTAITDRELAEQARAAADQALQLARLAEESARLARQLNEQVAIRADRTGSSTPTTGRATTPDAADQESLLTQEHAATDGFPSLENTSERWVALTGRHRVKGRRRSATPARSSSSPAAQVEGTHLSLDTQAQQRQPSRGPGNLRKSVYSWKSITLSTALHLIVLVALGVLTLTIRPRPEINTILASFVDDEAPAPAEIEEPLPVEKLPEEEVAPVTEEIADAPPPPPLQAEPEPQPPAAADEQREPVKEDRGAAPMQLAQQEQIGPAIDLTKVGSRSAAGKQILLKKYGGTAASEAALGRALAWLASIQRRDGSWNFNDVGGASHAGSVNNPMGATSYVLLTFLGAGQTHHEGQYKTSIGRGINFLIKFARPVPAGVDLRGPNVEENHNFYVQGAAAMALCEAFAMTRDRRLRIPAQRAINFIAAAQDPHGGGWRYEPFEPGCTSVTTLQLTAFISAQRSGLQVSPKTLAGISRYYDTVQCDGRPTGRYCYRAAEPNFKTASTAQAALGRMYLGATRDDEDLQAAVRILDERGPYDNRYYCYYATQVMKNWGGDEWERWNPAMRDELIRTQVAEEGPAMGSWTPLQRGVTDTAGGRLFTTVLSAMTLEVYYWYLPLYDSLVEEEIVPAADQQIATDGTDES